MSGDAVFDNFILADDVAVVDRWTDETWAVKNAKEGASAPSGPTVLHQLFDAANERPWLWLVYIVGLLIPICIMTMIFCPVKKERGGEGENGAVDADADGIKAERQYDAIHAETKEEEAARKKTDEPIPDVIDDELEAEQEEVVVVKPALEVETKAAPVEEINVAAPLTQAEDRQTTPVKAANGLLINGSDYATSNGVAEEEDEEEEARALGKSILNGISDEDEILRRSPRLKSKSRPRKE